MTMPNSATTPSVSLDALELDPATFALFGQVLAPLEDGVPFGPQDAELDISQGTPRFYVMRLYNRGMTFDHITRHDRVTQCLASVGGADWFIAVAPPPASDADQTGPAPGSIRAFRVPGNVAIKLHLGTWHAGPFFAPDEVSFFNLELADTNLVDHPNCNLAATHGCCYDITPA